MELRGAQEDLLDEKADAAAHRALVESTATGGALAMFDRNSFVDESWRKVILQRTGGSCWVLCDEHGEVLDEPDEGCPRGGFSTDVFDGEIEHHGRGFGCGTPRSNLIAIAYIVSLFSPWGSGVPFLVCCLVETTFKVTGVEIFYHLLGTMRTFSGSWQLTTATHAVPRPKRPKSDAHSLHGHTMASLAAAAERPNAAGRTLRSAAEVDQERRRVSRQLRPATSPVPSRPSWL